MAIRSICNSCFQAFEIACAPQNPADDSVVSAMLADGLLVEGMLPCPKGCGGRINFFADETIDQLVLGPNMREPLSLTVAELYKALHGGGLPEEIPKSAEVVDALLRANMIASADVEERSGRVYLHVLRLSNGLNIHLSPGVYGAQVTKIVRGKV